MGQCRGCRAGVRERHGKRLSSQRAQLPRGHRDARATRFTVLTVGLGGCWWSGEGERPDFARPVPRAGAQRRGAGAWLRVRSASPAGPAAAPKAAPGGRSRSPADPGRRRSVSPGLSKAASKGSAANAAAMLAKARARAGLPEVAAVLSDGNGTGNGMGAAGPVARAGPAPGWAHAWLTHVKHFF